MNWLHQRLLNSKWIEKFGIYLMKCHILLHCKSAIYCCTAEVPYTAALQKCHILLHFKKAISAICCSTVVSSAGSAEAGRRWEGGTVGGSSPLYLTVQCSAVQCSYVQCSAMQCSAVQLSVVQCSAVQCSIKKCITSRVL